MPITTVKPVHSLSEFLESIQKVRSKWPADRRAERKGEGTQLWYRGQEKVSWGLIPKIYRDEFRGDNNNQNEIQFEFHSRGRQVYPDGLPVDKWERYFLMQHYGAPTRLLDWTDNPLVALFFAVDRFEKLKLAPVSTDEEDAAVWVLDPSWLSKQLRKGVDGPLLPEFPEAKPYLPDLSSWKQPRVQLPAPIDPPHVDRRLAIHGSRFVIFGLTQNLTRTRAVRRRNCRLAKVPVAWKSLTKIADELEVCGVTWGQLFPDLDGLCKDIRRRWRRG